MQESRPGAVADSQAHPSDPAQLFPTPCNPALTQGVLGRPEGWGEVSLKLNYGSFSTMCEALTLSLVSTPPLTPRHKGRERKNHCWLWAIKKRVGNQRFTSICQVSSKGLQISLRKRHYRHSHFITEEIKALEVK